MCNEGESFTPSPMYPTTWPLFFSCFTTLSFCNGFILAKTLTSSTFLASSSSDILSISVPKSVSVFSNSTRLQILFAAYGLSPVNIFVVIPILFNFFNVAFASFLAGSKNATNPINVMFASSETLNTFTPLYSLFDAIAITCIPCTAYSLAFCSTISTISGVSSFTCPLYFTLVHTFKISSNAPLVNIL